MANALDYRIARRRMVTEQLIARGISSRPVIDAFMRVPRHRFVDPALGARAYDDCSFPIGFRQTISQPYTIASMVEALSVEPTHKVLEIGTGSGYQTAILSLLSRDVFSIERVERLSEKAEETLKTIETGRIRLKTGDGWHGWDYYAPFDRIIVSAAAKNRPDILLGQLADGGCLIAPVADGAEQIVLYRIRDGAVEERPLRECAFVPLKKGILGSCRSSSPCTRSPRGS